MYVTATHQSHARGTSGAHPAGGIIKVGDRVRIFTADEREHRFRVTTIDAQEVGGDRITIAVEHVSVPLDQIVAVETREISIGKSALLAGGVLGTMLFIFIEVAPAMILAASTP